MLSSSTRICLVNLSQEYNFASNYFFATVCVFNCDKDSVIDYMFKIKMKVSGTITAIVEGQDGKFYKGAISIEVAKGGCEG